MDNANILIFLNTSIQRNEKTSLKLKAAMYYYQGQEYFVWGRIFWLLWGTGKRPPSIRLCLFAPSFSHAGVVHNIIAMWKQMRSGECPHEHGNHLDPSPISHCPALALMRMRKQMNYELKREDEKSEACRSNFYGRGLQRSSHAVLPPILSVHRAYDRQMVTPSSFLWDLSDFAVYWLLIFYCILTS